MNAPIKSDELFSAWSRNQWKSVYLFAGEEDFLIDQAVTQAVAHWLSDESAGMNKDRFDGENHDAAAILEVAQTVPFLSSTRVLRVDNASKLSAADQKLIAEALPNLPPETRMLFIWGKEWRRDEAKKPLVEAILERGIVAIFWPPFPEQAQRWAVQRMRHYKKTIAPEAAAWLVQQSGEGLRSLDQELAKCAVYVGERPAIELEDIQASFGYGKAGSPFEWIALIRQRQGAKALQTLERLLEEGEEPLRLLALLSRMLRDWLSSKGSQDSPAVLALRFHVRRGEEHRFAQELARWSEDELTDALDECLKAEQSIKTGKELPAMALTFAVLRLCRLELTDPVR